MANTRKPGAPPGNTNALKHGFYSSHLTSTELSDLDQTSLTSLTDEIQSLRAISRRILASMAHADTSPADMLDHANCLSSLYTRIASLMRTHATLSSGQTDIAQALADALGDL